MGFALILHHKPKPLSREYSDAFDLTEHKEVVTVLPKYRSFSYGSTDHRNGGPVESEIKGMGDLNNDGIGDLVIDYYETRVPPLFLLSTPSGQFKQIKPSEMKAARRHIRNGELADINSDEYLDFVGFTTGDPGRVWIEEKATTLKEKLFPVVKPISF